MSKNAMAGAVTLCGVGLCVIGAALMMQNGNSAHAAGGMPPAAVAAIAAATHAQVGPTVVWYGVASASAPSIQYDRVYRAWSDGTLEMIKVQPRGSSDPCQVGYPPCASEWGPVSSPTQGFKAAADINSDQQINGADLATILGNWGDAPRVPFPPSDCPLNLINP